MSDLTNEELCQRIQQGDTDLLAQLWAQVERLAYWFAIRFYNKYSERCAAAGVNIDDLTQEAFLAVLDAVQAYDPDTGYKFTSYMNYPLKNRFKAATGSRENTKREPLNHCTSLDAPIGDDFDATLADTVPDEKAAAAFETVEDEIANAQLRAALNICLKTLTEDEQEVIRRRYFNREFLHTIADGIGLSRERVRQIEASGLRKLRRPANRRYILTAVEEAEHIAESTGFNASGLQRFRDTWTSSVELAYERIEAMRAGRSAAR